MRIGGTPWDEAVWRAIDGATLLQQGSHVPGSRGSRRSESRIYAQASDRRDQEPSPDSVADDYAAADEKKDFAAGQITASVDAWALGIEKSAVLVGVWEDHGVGVDLEFDSSDNYAEAHRIAAVQVAGAADLSRT